MRQVLLYVLSHYNPLFLLCCIIIVFFFFIYIFFFFVICFITLSPIIFIMLYNYCFLLVYLNILLFGFYFFCLHWSLYRSLCAGFSCCSFFCRSSSCSSYGSFSSCLLPCLSSTFYRA